MRVAFVLPLVLVALLAVPAAAKEGVRARLDAPVRLDAAPGKTITLRWHLVDDEGKRFNASGIYLRVSGCRRAPLIVEAKPRARGYTARVRVPERGIRKVLVGLEGWRIVGERKTRADAFFQFDPPLARDCQPT